MGIYIKLKNKTYTIQFKTIFKIILIALALISITKYFNFVDSNTKKLITNYSQFVEYAKKNDIAITQENYESYIENIVNK